MDNNFKISHGKPYPLGATVLGDGQVNFAVVINSEEKSGVILYDKVLKTEEKLSFCCCNKVGNIRCMKVSGIDINRYEYNYYVGDNILNDSYGKIVIGNDIWGKKVSSLRFGIYDEEYDWQGDCYPRYEFNDSILYLMHVRGFTKHKSSGVKNPGTFDGVVEKIPYLKELGITAIELMPVYNFVELEDEKNIEGVVLAPFDNPEPKLNYWGYKESFYFAPKQSYSAKGQNPVIAFKDMVKALHKAGIEVILQFFFPEKIKQGYIIEVLKHWMQEYHVDGFHLIGSKLPLALLGTEPMLTDTKLLCDNFPIDDIYENGKKPVYKNLAICRDDFMYDIRRLLKSDEGMVGKTLDYMKNMPAKTGDIHYMTHGNSFTLMDLVSYDRKHNEANGENNRDGATYNGSWNCGFEGATTKKSVKKLRLKQIKNAIVFNMMAKSTPLIVAGDEFGNSQSGNNNPYCLDNAITWLNWNQIEKNKDIYLFMKKMIYLRKQYNILHSDESFRMNDYLECGYPDLSFHSDEAWMVDADYLSRQFAMLHCGLYGKDEVFIYTAFNMHWIEHDFAVPKLPSGYKWEVFEYTNEVADINKISVDDHIRIKERSTIILIGKSEK